MLPPLGQSYWCWPKYQFLHCMLHLSWTSTTSCTLKFPCLPCLPTAVPPRPTEIWSPALIEIYIKEEKPTCFIHLVSSVIWHKILVDLGKGPQYCWNGPALFLCWFTHLALSSLPSLSLYIFIPSSYNSSYTKRNHFLDPEVPKLSFYPRQIFQAASSKKYKLISLKDILENTASSRHITWWCKLYKIRELTGYSFLKHE